MTEDVFDRRGGERRWPDETHEAVPDMTPEESEVPPVTLPANAGDQAPAGDPVMAWPPVSQDELWQLEERARARIADPEYRRRIQATDALARSIAEKQER